MWHLHTRTHTQPHCHTHLIDALVCVCVVSQLFTCVDDGRGEEMSVADVFFFVFANRKALTNCRLGDGYTLG
ncbi:hypothetical protein EON63_23045 [archaeon]|nr:MAG: hypothetical protein EON63_23045 [archaeon]